MPLPVAETMLNNLEDEWDISVPDKVHTTVMKVLVYKKFEMATREKKEAKGFDLREALNTLQSHWAAAYSIQKTPVLAKQLADLLNDPKWAGVTAPDGRGIASTATSPATSPMSSKKIDRGLGDPGPMTLNSPAGQRLSDRLSDLVPVPEV